MIYRRAFGLALLALVASLTNAQTVTVTATPNAGVDSVTTTVTWSTSGFPTTPTCTASGGWSGTKAATGTETFAVNATTTYTLSCSGGTQSAVLTWMPPTTNTDGTPITNLSHYLIYHSGSPTGVSSATPNPVRVNAPASTFTITGLPVGMRYLAMNAWNTNGVASVLTGIVSKDVLAATASGSATVTVTPRPNPPTNVTVAVVPEMNMTVVYNVTTGGALGAALKGFAPLNVQCGETVVGTLRGVQFREIPAATVSWWGRTSKRVAAPCGAQL